MNLTDIGKKTCYTLIFSLLSLVAIAQEKEKTDEPKAPKRPNHGFAFEQLGTVLPTPNDYRTADGSPGPEYWQQKVDYKIECSLDPEKQQLTGKEHVTYHNNSPQTLRYLWLQLDENQHAATNDLHHAHPHDIGKNMNENGMRMLESWTEFEEYGHRIKSVTDNTGKPLRHFIDNTVMRVELPKPLAPGQKFDFNIDWSYVLIDRVNNITFGRGGYEYFEKDENYLFTITQWFPRLCVYSDFEGWQSDQFTGTGEFALNFGDYDVKITLPDDFTVGGTGVCHNYEQMLPAEQLARWKKAQASSEPIEIVTLDEANKLEKKKKSKTTKTWHYKAENVRDFAWTACRRFIWDAMAVKNQDGKPVMCMSYYPREAYPIYRRYSTKAVAHTINTYGKFAIPYPYPTAISVEAQNGMEYPMICFNPGRAEEDGTYSEGSKNACITVVIHEVGHNYFPMIINSDERQWAWFDEGINTFMQYITEQEWDNNYDSGEGPPHQITWYMNQDPDELEPIMTNSENIVNYFANAYAKPATALNILRETVMGREKFDYAFKAYCEKWAFKHPTPADFFRTMEDASGQDLDWFWRGWFYGIEKVDISLDSIEWLKVDLENNPERKEQVFTDTLQAPFETLTKARYREEVKKFPVEKDTSLQDFYTFYKPWETEDSIQTSKMVRFDETFSKKEKKELFGDKNYYELRFSNKGGLVTPVILEWTFTDGTREIERIPVEIWRKNEQKFTQVFVKNKEVKSIKLDPWRETADVDETNNTRPMPTEPKLFMVYKKHKFEQGENMMQKAKKRKPLKP
ncbi:MAG: M1 family metallopeptidase [Saprospiraceae bacterium]|nr:M1 family metallopeptidase [Saprospiraceae bacterium]